MWKADRASVFETFVEIRPAIRSYVVSEVVADDVAVLHANWSVVAPDGTVLGEGRSTEVPKKLENGGWRYLIDCPNGLPELDQ